MWPKSERTMTGKHEVDDRLHRNHRINISRWRSHFSQCYVLLYILLIFENMLYVSCDSSIYTAKVNITYTEQNEVKSIVKDMGVFGGDASTPQSRTHPEAGQLVLVRTTENKTDACHAIVNAPKKRWVALVERGNCNLIDKVNICGNANASAVIIFNNEDPQPNARPSYTLKGSVLAIFVTKADGRMLQEYMNSYGVVSVQILEGHLQPPPTPLESSNSTNISKTSVMFVSISFVVLMIISLAWLVFYYIQRFRYAHAKERLTRRLASAAKKAIAKIPQRTLKLGDRELDPEFDQCAVCIEGYKTSDVVRTLPCKHIFHKSCVDPWLLDQRSCPMCKLDILRAYGMHISHLSSSQESVHAEPDSSELTGSGLEADPVLISPEQHHHSEGVEVLLIRHPSVHYHGSDTFCDEEERAALQPHPPSPSRGSHEALEIEPNSDSESECSESNSLMSGSKTQSQDKLRLSSNLHDTSEV
uniref:RING finger protein 150-like n=1 Tax=Crassostrea virginica TaxID=6565 RepID=A0A8B8CZ56_CRAVI|nr:RING finger protein 150-like [Crassostrea virginica]